MHALARFGPAQGPAVLLASIASPHARCGGKKTVSGRTLTLGIPLWVCFFACRLSLVSVPQLGDCFITGLGSGEDES
jgi:hypothetical protein